LKFFIEKTSTSTRRPQVANSRTKASNNRTSKRVVRTSGAHGVLTPSPAVRMRGAVKPMGKVVSLMNPSARCDIKGASSTAGKGFSFSLSGWTFRGSGWLVRRTGGKPDTFFFRAIWKADFRVNGANRGKKTDKKPGILFRIKEGKDLSAVSAVIFLPRNGASLGRSFVFGFYRGEIGFLADFLFREVAFCSFAKVSASRRVRAFANVQNQGRTKNMTKKLCGAGFIPSF